MNNEILQTALQQFLKHGIREMSIQKIVEPLGISTKTVYKYFRNKKELLEEVLHLHHTQQYERLKNIAAKQSAVCLLFDLWLNAVEGEYDVNNASFKDLHYYYPELENKIEAAVAGKFTQEFIRIIQRGIKEGSFRKDVMPKIVLESIYVLYVAIARSEQFKRFRLPPDSIVLNTIAIIIKGICTVKGAEELEEHIQTRQLSVNGKKNKKTLSIIHEN